MRYKISMPRGFGVVEAIIVAAAVVILAVILYPIFAPRHHPSMQPQCMTNQRQIAIAFSMYTQEHDETFPDASIAWTLFKNENAPVYRCPDYRGAVNGYVFNARVSKRKLSDLSYPISTTCFLTADGKSSEIPGTYANVAYDQTNIDTQRHKGSFYSSFVDGHVEMINNREIITTWLPAKSQQYTSLTCTAGVAQPVTTTHASATWAVTSGVADNVSGLPAADMLGGDVTFTKAGMYTITATGSAAVEPPTTVYEFKVK